jgi:putative flippase GtrA
LFKRLARDRVTQRLFATYVAIGGFVFLAYMGLFSALVSLRVPLNVAATVAYFSATALHFTLNRYANFRRFDRAVHDQARTFVTVVVVQWLVLLAIVNVLVARGARPALATTIALIVNLPLGFVANRYLTFGIGIVPRLGGAGKAVNRAERR